METSGRRKAHVCGIILAVALVTAVHAAAPTAVVSASPVTGPAPLGVLFDASSSSPDSVYFLWDFGDGGASTAQTVTHVYTVAGTYNAQLAVTNAQGLQNIAQLAITVTGSDAGPVTDDMNFRLALTASSFTLNHAKANKDKFQLNAAFNTVDLPAILTGVPASFSINDIYTITGVLGTQNGFESPTNSKPAYQLLVNQKLQQLQVTITAADLSEALDASGAGDISAANLQVPVTFTLTIGAETYIMTENFNYTSAAGASGKGVYNLSSQAGSVSDGFFVISNASAIENLTGTGYYFTFATFLSRPLAQLLSAPPPGGAFVFTFNESNSVTILFDRIRQHGNQLTYTQPDRDLGGVWQFKINPVARRMTISTWDLPSDSNVGGTGLPLPGQYFKAFNFALRLEMDQTDGTTLQAVTATRLTRKTVDDAFWQTGRRIKR